MTKEITKANAVFTNKGLQKATEKIIKLENGIQRNLYETAAIIAQVDNEQLFVDDGFKNVHEWTKKTFGIAKTASYNMLKIGSKYTRKVLENGKVKGYRSNLTDDNEADYNTTQIIKMLVIPREEIEQVIKEEEITPALTCEEIENRIRHYQHKDDIEVEAKEVEEPEEAEEIADGESVGEEVKMTKAFALELFGEISKSKTKKAQELTERLANILNI